MMSRRRGGLKDAILRFCGWGGQYGFCVVYFLLFSSRHSLVT